MWGCGGKGEGGAYSTNFWEVGVKNFGYEVKFWRVVGKLRGESERAMELSAFIRRSDRSIDHDVPQQ